jgi:glycosyltransferase involved in cell wall biosynthesis
MPRICIVPRVTGCGGMASFRLKFEEGLRKRGVAVSYHPDETVDAILVIGGTRHLLPLWRAKRRGTRILQRLDGINWVQRVRWSGLRYSVRAEYGNALLAFTRAHLADRVAYQSAFIRRWWEDWYGVAPVPGQVILNGVDLEAYSPKRPGGREPKRYRLLVVEGSLAGGLDTGLKAAVRLAGLLAQTFPVELTVVGTVERRTQTRLAKSSSVPVSFPGVVPRTRIPEIMRASHLLFSAEINPPCPNSVIEALACGTPVVGFDTGSLKELVTGDAGRLVPYGGDPWRLTPPDVPALAAAAVEILREPERFRKAARERAEQVFSVDMMVEAYLKATLED